jgi:L-rhamnonate dehydratase
VVEVELDDGTVGIGASVGGEPACYIIEQHLSRFVEGQDPRDIELMWDQMWRGSMPYGRKGLPIQAIGAVDLAIWDVLGKLRGEPVYALLGGKTKDRLPVYATTARPDLAKEMGFVAAKMPCQYGPAQGREGLKKNVEAFRAARESVGPDFPLRLDCYMSLTVPYAIELAQALAPYGLDWIEECLPPDDYDGYARLREALTGVTLVTTGDALRLPRAHRPPLRRRPPARRQLGRRAHRVPPHRRHGRRVRPPGHPARLQRLQLPHAVRLPELPRRRDPHHEPRSRPHRPRLR